MARARDLAVRLVVSACVVVVAASRPALASPARQDAAPGPVARFGPTRGEADAQPVGDPAPLRALLRGNVSVQPELVSIFEELLVASPTMRGQLKAIQRVRRLSVSLTLIDACDVDGAPCQAKTRLTRYAEGPMVAQVCIRRDARLAEGIGHELEHVCEWIEGALRRFMVSDDRGYYEVRARRAGEVVGREHRAWQRRQVQRAARAKDAGPDVKAGSGRSPSN